MAGRPPLALRIVPFDEETFVAEVRTACGAEPLGEAEEIPRQIRYLTAFLKRHDRPAKALLIESPYVDRHYLEEFAGYYATALYPPPSKTTRIHVLSEKHTDEQFRLILERASAGEFQAGCDALQAIYLGYIVVRPIPSAPIGRTVLAPYESTKVRRCFAPATTHHSVHIAGLNVQIDGVPFQQQDQAVGACATTAIWSAISRVARADGGRAPTPLAITLAATRHLLSDRPLPALSGLDLSQTLAAIRESGFSPWVLKAEVEHDTFKLALKCCVRSGIPVILQLRYESDAALHAVTVVGFREDDDAEPAADIAVALGGGSVTLRAKGMSRIYAHDDRLGPYARFVWQSPTGEATWPLLQFLAGQPGFEKYEAPGKIWNAIVPLYPKLRLAPTDLIALASELLPLMRFLAGEENRDRLKVDLQYAHSGRYLEEVFRLGIDGVRKLKVATTAVLPRYVGIVRFSIDDEWLVDIVCDTTDIKRDAPTPILMAIPRYVAHSQTLQNFRALSSASVI
jgi:hypothetical protein